MIIKGCELQNEIVLEIGKFSILWNCFERDWCDNHCNPTKIKSIIEKIHIDKEKQIYFSNILNKRRNWLGQLEESYVKEHLHPGNARLSTEEDIKIMNEFLKQEGDNQLYGCLLVICRMRNNLMHGLKLLEELEDQIELFRAANAVLENCKFKTVITDNTETLERN